jgi:hypothetical protein
VSNLAGPDAESLHAVTARSTANEQTALS